MTSLAEKIKELRVVKKMSQGRLAKGAAIGPSYLSGIERGLNDNPAFKIVQGLARELDVSLDYLGHDGTDETRSWQQVAAEESLQLLAKRSDLSTEEANGLKRVSLTGAAPLTLRQWEELLTSIRAYVIPEPVVPMTADHV